MLLIDKESNQYRVQQKYTNQEELNQELNDCLLKQTSTPVTTEEREKLADSVISEILSKKTPPDDEEVVKQEKIRIRSVVMNFLQSSKPLN